MRNKKKQALEYVENDTLRHRSPIWVIKINKKRPLDKTDEAGPSTKREKTNAGNEPKIPINL
jgi:hypothetical protein